MTQMRQLAAGQFGIRSAECGVTLIEMIIVVTLLGIFMGAVYESVIVGLRAANSSDERESIRQQLANALDILTREAALASTVDLAQDQQFQFDADLDGNGTTENNINYQVNSGDLQRIYNGVTVTLVSDLTSLDFDFTDSSGADMTTPVGSPTNRDTIRVTQVTTTATRDNETLSLASAAYLRNN